MHSIFKSMKIVFLGPM